MDTPEVVALVVALVAAGAAVYFHLRVSGLTGAELLPTGDLAEQDGELERVACQGSIVSDETLEAPQSCRPCVYYELKVEEERRSSGDSHWHTIKHIHRGTTFWVDDGSGPVEVSPQGRLEGQLVTTFDDELEGDIGLSALVAEMLTSTTGRKRAKEWVVPAKGQLFVMGRLAGGRLRPSEGLTGALTVSTAGREALVERTQLFRNLALAGTAAALLATGFLAMQPGPAPARAAHGPRPAKH